MKKTFLILFLIIVGCKSSDNINNKKINPILDFHTTDLISLTVPTIYEGNIKYMDATDKMVLKDVDDVVHDNTILHSLSDILSSVTIYKSNEEGTLTLLGNSISGKNETYRVIYDFTQTQTIQKVNKNDTIKKAIGIAVRMIAEVNTKKRGIDLSNIFKLSIDAEKEHVSGRLTVRSVGISSKKVNQSIPTTTDLSPASIATALQTVATIKSSIYDNETKITPYFIGFCIPGKSTNDKVKIELEKLIL